MIEVAPWYFDYIACPDCGGKLDVGEAIECRRCEFRKSTGEPLDLLPIGPEVCEVKLPRQMTADPEEKLVSIETSRPGISLDIPPGLRDSTGLMSEIFSFLGKKGRVLDLGCGPRDQAEPVEYHGDDYVGIDHSSRQADLLGDAHAIPFRSGPFDCVFSYAVLEHLHSPFVAVAEIERVLKPGGVYVGTVSQGEPFHDSFFHHTA